MFGSVVTNAVSRILISLLIDIAIFNIIYSTINSGINYSKNVILYAICMEIKLIIMTGIASFSMFLLTIGLYLVTGLILIWLLHKISDYFPRGSFIATAIVLQAIVNWLIGFLI